MAAIYSRSTRNSINDILVFCSFAILLTSLAFLEFGPLLHAGLTLVDDHEYFLLLGPTQHLGLFEIPQRLLDLTELGKWGEYARFRPFYFLERGVESTLFGLDPYPRFFLRILIVACFSTTIAGISWFSLRNVQTKLWHSICRYISSLIFGIACLYLSSWTDIVFHLGPSEIWVALGLILYLIGMVILWVSPANKFAWPLTLSGYLVSILSKENTFVLLLPVIFLAFIDFTEKKRRAQAITAVVLAIAGTLWVELGIFIAMQSNGADVYGQTRTLSTFGEKVISEPYIYVTILMFTTSLAMEIRASQIGKLKGSESISRYLLLREFPASGLSAFALVVVLSEGYVYQHSSEKRYLLLTQLVILIAIIATLSAAKTLLVARETFFSVVTIVISVVTLSILGNARLLPWSPSSLRTQAEAAATNSQKVSQEIKRLMESIQSHPGLPVVIEMYPPRVEHAFAVSRITWFASGEKTYLANSMPLLQTGAKDLLFNDETYQSHMSPNGAICVQIGDISNDDVNCIDAIKFDY